MIVAEFSVLVTTSFKQLQGHRVTISMQWATIVAPRMSPFRPFGKRCRLSESKAVSLVDDLNLVFSKFHHISAPLPETKQHAMKLGSFSMNMFQTLDAFAIKEVVNNVAVTYVSCAPGDAITVAERHRSNQRDDALPPVVPCRLATLSQSEFGTTIGTHRERLVSSLWTPIRIYSMEEEHNQLVWAVVNEPALHLLFRHEETTCHLVTVGLF